MNHKKINQFMQDSGDEMKQMKMKQKEIDGLWQKSLQQIKAAMDSFEALGYCLVHQTRLTQ